MRIFKNHPISKLVNSHVIDSPQPSNLSYIWNLGWSWALYSIIQIGSWVISFSNHIAWYVKMAIIIMEISGENQNAHIMKYRITYYIIFLFFCQYSILIYLDSPLNLFELLYSAFIWILWSIIFYVIFTLIKYAVVEYYWMLFYTKGMNYAINLYWGVLRMLWIILGLTFGIPFDENILHSASLDGPQTILLDKEEEIVIKMVNGRVIYSNIEKSVSESPENTNNHEYTENIAYLERPFYPTFDEYKSKSIEEYKRWKRPSNVSDRELPLAYTRIYDLLKNRKLEPNHRDDLVDTKKTLFSEICRRQRRGGLINLPSATEIEINNNIWYVQYKSKCIQDSNYVIINDDTKDKIFNRHLQEALSITYKDIFYKDFSIYDNKLDIMSKNDFDFRSSLQRELQRRVSEGVLRDVPDNYAKNQNVYCTKGENTISNDIKEKSLIIPNRKPTKPNTTLVIYNEISWAMGMTNTKLPDMIVKHDEVIHSSYDKGESIREKVESKSILMDVLRERQSNGILRNLFHHEVCIGCRRCFLHEYGSQVPITGTKENLSWNGEKIMSVFQIVKK